MVKKFHAYAFRAVLVVSLLLGCITVQAEDACQYGGTFDDVSSDIVTLCFPEKVSILKFEHADIAGYAKSSDLSIFAWLSAAEPSLPITLTSQEVENIKVIFWLDKQNIYDLPTFYADNPDRMMGMWRLSWAPINGNEGAFCSLFYGRRGVGRLARVVYCAAVREGESFDKVQERFKKFLAAVRYYKQ